MGAIQSIIGIGGNENTSNETEEEIGREGTSRKQQAALPNGNAAHAESESESDGDDRSNRSHDVDDSAEVLPTLYHTSSRLRTRKEKVVLPQLRDRLKKTEIAKKTETPNPAKVTEAQKKETVRLRFLLDEKRDDILKQVGISQASYSRIIFEARTENKWIPDGFKLENDELVPAAGPSRVNGYNGVSDSDSDDSGVEEVSKANGEISKVYVVPEYKKKEIVRLFYLEGKSQVAIRAMTWVGKNTISKVINEAKEGKWIPDGYLMKDSKLIRVCEQQKARRPSAQNVGATPRRAATPSKVATTQQSSTPSRTVSTKKLLSGAQVSDVQKRKIAKLRFLEGLLPVEIEEKLGIAEKYIWNICQQVREDRKWVPEGFVFSALETKLIPVQKVQTAGPSSINGKRRASTSSYGTYDSTPSRRIRRESTSSRL